MANLATTSKKATVSIKVANAYVKINGLKGFDGLRGGSAAVMDSTDLDSDAKEKLMGLPDEGSVKLSFNYLEADAGQLAVIAARASQALTSFQIKMRSGRTFTYDAFVKTAAISTGVDTIVPLEVETEISGAIVEATGAPVV